MPSLRKIERETDPEERKREKEGEIFLLWGNRSWGCQTPPRPSLPPPNEDSGARAPFLCLSLNLSLSVGGGYERRRRGKGGAAGEVGYCWRWTSTQRYVPYIPIRWFTKTGIYTCHRLKGGIVGPRIFFRFCSTVKACILSTLPRRTKIRNHERGHNRVLGWMLFHFHLFFGGRVRCSITLDR